ncbi:ATP-binding cassette domain-containing protein [uncultured Draconibacterium sp.]|uniref:ATP-binding cassette domain-containing protein n=1 Tax=uncultured Draconibacterium sp. TaxID=1573823 RepID=UPI0029C6CE01|nr:ATP-binding cassette domain-containing protein [uncultured Draconibacterium sp.]
MQITVNDIQFSFGERKIFDKISFSIPPNEVTAIVGVSGCGKSTLLKLLSGLKTVDQGTIEYGNKQTIALDSMAIIFQDSTLFPWKTVKENIRLASKGRVNIQEIAEEVGLSHSLDLYPDQLSGGMKQRAEFGRVIARSPRILFMDEPFSRLDIQYRRHLQEVFLKLQKKNKPTTVIVTHDINEAIKVAKHIKVLVGNPIQQICEFEISDSSNEKIKEDVENILCDDFTSNLTIK